MKLFFDTSALIKFYSNKAGTEKVTRLILNKNNSIIISEIAIIEFISAIHKKFRNKEINYNDLKEAIGSFQLSINEFTVEPFVSAIKNEATRIIFDFGSHQTIRTLDSIQLATYHLIADKNSAFVCCDNNLILAAKFFKNTFINPLE